jgi:homoserine dehydrogenase
MSSNGWSYEQALQQAQELGFAEADPTLDVEGYDALYKLVLLAAHSFGILVKPQHIPRFGISTLRLHDIDFAREKGLRYRLIASVQKVADQQVALSVLPTLIGPEHELYHLPAENNGVIVEAAFSDKQVFKGKGAGGHPTGSAVLSDISANTYNYRYAYHKLRRQQTDNYWQSTLNVPVRVYFSYSKAEQYDRSQFDSVEVEHRQGKQSYIIGQVPLVQLLNNEYFRQQGTFLAAFPQK